MSQGGGASGAPKKGLTLDDLIAAIDRHERNPSNIPKVDTFHFCGEKVLEWLERVEQALVGRSDVEKFQRILQYVLHSYHQEVKKVIDAAQGSSERFKEGMQRKYRLEDGLLTTADLEAMNKEDFTTIGAFVQEFKKRARKVHGISEEAQCAIFLGLLTASEAVELTRHGGGNTKLTWATIDRGVEVGCLDQVEQRQVRLQRQKRKERDATASGTASGTPGVTRIVTDVLAQLGYATEPVEQRRVETAVKMKGKEPVIEEAVEEELWEEEEPVPQHLTKAQRKVRNLAQGGQGSGKAQAPQAQAAAPLNVAASSSSMGPSQGGAPSYGQWPWPVINAIVPWGSPPPVAGPQTRNEEELIIGEPDFLLPQERTLMVELMKRRHRAYAFNDGERGRLDVDKIPMIRIHTVPHEPWNMRGARYPNPDEEKKVVDYLDGKIRTQVADYSSGPYVSSWFCFITPNGTLRWVQDLQRLNAVTVRDARGLPNAHALSESCAGRPIISPIDLYSGYDQFPVYPSDRHVTAMHTPRGLIHMNVASQGWTNAVAMVQRAMIRAMQSVSSHIRQPYIDDLAVKGPAVKESDEVSPGVRRFVWKHIQDLEKVLSLLEEHNLTASGAKSRHCMREATILGFVCSKKGRRPNVKKTDKITEWPVPFHSITDVRSLLGTCGFWRAFVKNFTAKTEHLRKLVRKDQEWVWGKEQEEVVARMKEEFRGGLVLGAPDYYATETRPFIVETDAGPTALGGVLIQADMEGKERPLRFESRTLCTTERNYSQFNRETLAVLHCLRIFRNYIFGRRFILRVDPTALAYSLRNYVPSDPTVARWLTYIWMFNFELERIPGSKNRADGLSRINWDKQEGEAVENTPPVDGFLDQEEDVPLHINKWSSRVPSCVGYTIWQAPNGYERRAELVLKLFEEEDPGGGRDIQWMMELALTSSHSLVEDMRTIEEGPGQVERHEDLMGGMYLLVNTLLQESLDQSGPLNPEGNMDEMPESQDDEFEEGEIKEAFRAEKYDGIYLELELLLSCEMRLRDASDRAQRMLQRYLVRDDHLFVRREVGNPRRVVCGRNRQIDVVAALHDGIAGGHRGVQATSDFTKTTMPRGGRGTRPPRRPLGASRGYERHGPRHRESTPVYDDGDIELFLDSFWDYARRMGWTVAQAIERLRGADRFEEPVARIRREATTRSEVEWRMQELRPSPVGPDGRPIHLEIGNASDFIPAFEWFMQGQGIPRNDWMQTLPLGTRKAERPLASQIKSMARDWESCRAHLREAFRRPEPPQPRVERRQRSQRQRDPEPREARPSRGGRKALARREEEPELEPEAEERGAYPECGLGPVEFHRFTEGGLRRSPARTQEEPPASEGPLRELETHLDISRWGASP
ncbi:hypothetical protein CBR_g54036 [Chara braunii]|uniref:Reverse transcriptase RNase H-like domain-containing protein n=1 Tax=Chara braunii TaxID=69332 RepID=A0A388MBK9_CHABU|nr:hypothetical protein CBR_g54036 [Chara braunii]|eukprot:GBG91940.1 hypothetical protein CBR_g54036 [Chara braunii]